MASSRETIAFQINQHELVKMGLMDDPASRPALGSPQYA